MASEIVLKPCPCCGGHATMEHGAERSENCWVVCMECGLSTRYHHDPAEAAAEWNRRACDAHHETPSTVHNGDCVPQTERNAAATGEKPEVADAVIAEMRERAKFLRDGRDHGIVYVKVLGCYLDETLADLADRLEAALKRERASFDCECAGIAELAAKEEAARHKPGNAEAMREALLKIRRELNDYCNGCTLLDRMTEDPPDYTCLRDSLLEIERIVAAALAAPPRNCDVGTPEEQQERFNRFCKPCSDSCPFSECKTIVECAIKWAQTPYAAQEGAGE